MREYRFAHDAGGSSPLTFAGGARYGLPTLAECTSTNVDGRHQLGQRFHAAAAGAAQMAIPPPPMSLGHHGDGPFALTASSTANLSDQALTNSGERRHARGRRRGVDERYRLRRQGLGAGG